MVTRFTRVTILKMNINIEPLTKRTLKHDTVCHLYFNKKMNKLNSTYTFYIYTNTYTQAGTESMVTLSLLKKKKIQIYPRVFFFLLLFAFIFCGIYSQAISFCFFSFFCATSSSGLGRICFFSKDHLNVAGRAHVGADPTVSSVKSCATSWGLCSLGCAQ